MPIRGAAADFSEESASEPGPRMISSQNIRQKIIISEKRRQRRVEMMRTFFCSFVLSAEANVYNTLTLHDSIILRLCGFVAESNKALALSFFFPSETLTTWSQLPLQGTFSIPGGMRDRGAQQHLVATKLRCTPFVSETSERETGR